MGKEKIDHLQEFLILQLEKRLRVTIWCIFLSTKMRNRPIVRRWGIRIGNHWGGFFSFFPKKIGNSIEGCGVMPRRALR